MVSKIKINVLKGKNAGRLPPFFKEKILRGVRWKLKKEEIKQTEISILFCSDKKIKKLHKDFMNLNTLTDCLTFHNEDEKASILQGDIAVSLPTARRQALAYRHSLTRELLILSFHGLIHLLGGRDHTKAGRKQMMDEVLKILSFVLQSKTI